MTSYPQPGPDAPRYESSPPLPMGIGQVMRFVLFPEERDDSPWRRRSEMTYDPAIENAVVIEVCSLCSPSLAYHPWRIISVLEGEVTVTVAGKEFLLTPDSPPASAPRGVVHSIKGTPGIKTTVCENNTYGDARDKEEFFRHALADTDIAAGDKLKMINFARAMWEGDGWPSISGWKVFDRVFMYLLGPLSKFMAPEKPSLPDEKEYLSSQRQLDTASTST